MRAAIAIVLLFGTACGSSPSGTGDSTSTGVDESTGTTNALTSSTSSTSVADDSSGTTATSSLPDVPPPDTDTDATTGEPPQAADYCESIVDSFCAFYLRCGRMDVDSVEACHAPFLESCNAVFEPQYVELEALGLLSLSEEGLAACEQHLADVACEQQIFELTGPCSQIWAGTQAAG